MCITNDGRVRSLTSWTQLAQAVGGVLTGWTPLALSLTGLVLVLAGCTRLAITVGVLSDSTLGAGGISGERTPSVSALSALSLFGLVLVLAGCTRLAITVGVLSDSTLGAGGRSGERTPSVSALSALSLTGLVLVLAGCTRLAITLGVLSDCTSTHSSSVRINIIVVGRRIHTTSYTSNNTALSI
jgi:uncharacterized membrane protein